MLQGLAVAPDPMRINPAEGRTFEVVYEDQDIIVIDKPSEFLSVPGIHITDSVYTQILAQYPSISGPIIIHRLDTSTAGLLVLAKHLLAHQYIQQHCIVYFVVKRYPAILGGILTASAGLIDLPLRVDPDD